MPAHKARPGSGREPVFEIRRRLGLGADPPDLTTRSEAAREDHPERIHPAERDFSRLADDPRLAASQLLQTSSPPSRGGAGAVPVVGPEISRTRAAPSPRPGRPTAAVAMNDVTHILLDIEQATPRRPSSSCRWSTTSCASSPPSGLPRRGPARRSRPRRWSTRRTCGWWTSSRPRPGTAGGTSSPPPPRRCGGSWSRRPGAGPD